jgi:DNA-binding MarR family transcriptional regulator
MASAPADDRVSAAPEDPVYDAFAESLTDLFRVARRKRGEVGQAGSRPLSLSQFAVLQTIDEEGDATVTELARAASVAVPTVTRMLCSLERDDIVERNRADDDRRVVRVHLTQGGKDLMAEKRAFIGDRLRSVYDGLSPAERRAATPLLRRFAALLDEL